MMNIFTRITATLTGKLDEMVAQVENHDAVVAVALKDTRAAVAKAKVRLDRVRKDGEAMRQRLQEAQRMEKLWENRAKETAAKDEQKALACLARRNQCREQTIQIQTALTRHEELEIKVRDNVQRMEQRLRDITQQQNLMRSRQSTADAMRIISKIESNTDNGIEDTFDRWEMLITETEYSLGHMSDTDALDMSFVKEENAAQLQAELAELLDAEKGEKK
ncbi:MAG: PspA/IM30 family protein [Alphaproteobacteria bacterium]|nr:PspA/IM30 family protein [Alphaproteobacteria bacterium]